MFVVWFVSFAALTGRGDWNDLMNFVHAAPLVPRARRPKGRRALVRSPGDDGQRSGARRKYKRCITNTRVTGYRTAKPSDSPPRASRYAQSHACRPPARKACPPPRRLPPPRPSGGHGAPTGPSIACGDEPAGRRSKGSRGRKCARRQRWVRSARSLMVAAAARRQGTSP